MTIQGHATTSPQVKVQPTKPAPPRPDLRSLYVNQLLRGVKDEPSIHYMQLRPIPQRYQLPMRTDCSGYVTVSAQVSGCPDPNGRHFDGQGYTGTLLDHCAHVPFTAVRPGDLIVYGNHPGHHVVAVTALVRDNLGRVTDFMVVSHGQEKGPATILHSVEQQYQPFPANYLSFLP